MSVSEFEQEDPDNKAEIDKGNTVNIFIRFKIHRF